MSVWTNPYITCMENYRTGHRISDAGLLAGCWACRLAVLLAY